MRRLPADVPAWPAWMAAAALGAAWVATGVAALLVALALSIAGADDLTPAGTLAIAVGGALATVAAVVVLARSQGLGDPRPEHFGLRPTGARVGVAALALGLVAVAALGALAAVLGHPFAQPSIPPELSEQPALARATHGLDLTRVDPGPAAVASIVARAVVAVAVAEVLVRGLVFPALATALGTPAAAGVVSVISGGLGALTGTGGALVVPAIALGLGLCWLYAETGSVVPGVGVACAAAGASLAAGLGWTATSCAVCGLLCALGGLALVLPAALGRPAAPASQTVPGGPTATWDLRPSQG
jgi:membrane protease YdiL (CAAX protease family)